MVQESVCLCPPTLQLHAPYWHQHTLQKQAGCHFAKAVPALHSQCSLVDEVLRNTNDSTLARLFRRVQKTVPSCLAPVLRLFGCGEPPTQQQPIDRPRE